MRGGEQEGLSAPPQPSVGRVYTHVVPLGAGGRAAGVQRLGPCGNEPGCGTMHSTGGAADESFDAGRLSRSSAGEMVTVRAETLRLLTAAVTVIKIQFPPFHAASA